MNIQGAVPGLSTCFGLAGPSRVVVQILGPFKFSSGGRVKSFVEEASANLVAYESFPGSGAGQPEGRFVKSGSLPPSVGPLVSMGKDKQGLEGIVGAFQESMAFSDRLIAVAQEGEDPDSFQVCAVC